MGTNYYLFTKNKQLCDEFFPFEYEIVDQPEFGYRIHVSKNSYGWKTLGQIHKNAFSTLEQFRFFYQTYEAELSIVDEEKRIVSLDKFVDTIINRGAPSNKYVKFTYRHDERCGRPMIFEDKCSVEEADLALPLSHCEYQTKYHEAQHKYGVYPTFDMSIKYYEDPVHPMEWTEGEFS